MDRKAASESNSRAPQGRRSARIDVRLRMYVAASLGTQPLWNSTVVERLSLKTSASAHRELQRDSARGTCNKLRSFVKLSCPVAVFRNKMAETPSGRLAIAELANSMLATISDGKLLSNRSSKFPPF